MSVNDTISPETLGRELLSTAKKICDDVRKDWSTYTSVEGNAEIEANLVDTDFVEVAFATRDKSSATVEIVASGQKAWIVEHGKGSLMDNESENPGLAAYKASSLWNVEREGTEVRTRTGEYEDLDGNTHEGSGIGGQHGLNAEKLKSRSREPIQPLPGQHVIKQNVEDGVHLKALEDNLYGVGYDFVRKHISDSFNRGL